MGEEGLRVFLIDDSPSSLLHLSSSVKLSDYYKRKGWLFNKGGNCLMWIKHRVESSHQMFPWWNSNLEIVGLEKPHCIHSGLPCQLEAMQRTGNLHGGVFLRPRPVHAGTGSNTPPPMALNGIKRVAKTDEWMSASMWSACTLQFTGRLTGWTTEPAQRKPHSAVYCVYERLHWNQAVMRLIIYMALGAAGIRSKEIQSDRR